MTDCQELQTRLDDAIADFEVRKLAMQRACEDLQVALEVEHGARVYAEEKGKALEEEKYRLLDIIVNLVDPDPCRYDHHGYCQAHDLAERPCPHEVAKAAIAGKI